MIDALSIYKLVTERHYQLYLIYISRDLDQRHNVYMDLLNVVKHKLNKHFMSRVFQAATEHIRIEWMAAPVETVNSKLFSLSLLCPVKQVRNYKIWFSRVSW